jgi:hypothetical protein
MLMMLLNSVDCGPVRDFDFDLMIYLLNFSNWNEDLPQFHEKMLESRIGGSSTISSIYSRNCGRSTFSYWKLHKNHLIPH